MIASAACTLAVFVSLPLIDYYHHGGERDLNLLAMDRLEPPPPPPPPPRRRLDPVAGPSLPELARETPRPRLPLRANLRLDLALGDVTGDFALDFAVATPGIEAGDADYIFDITEIDAPPRYISGIIPVYPPRARVQRIEGIVQLEFVVGLDGKVRGAKVIRATPEDIFDDAALRAVNRWTFKPGSRAGRPVVVRVRQDLQFSLER